MAVKRILQVVPSLNIGSGVTQVVMNLYRNIDREKFQFDFLYFSEMPYTVQDEIEKLGGRTYHIPKLSLKNCIGFTKTVFGFLQTHGKEYEAVHLHEVLVGIILLPLTRKFGIKKRFVHSHNSRPSEKWYKNLRNKLLCMPIKYCATDYLACSKLAGEFLYGKEVDFKVVDNGVDVRKYRFNPDVRMEARHRLGLEDEDKVIGHIGRFCIQKNQTFLLPVIKELVRRDKTYKFIFIGNGPKYEEFRQLCKKEGIEEYIRLLGVRNDIPVLLQALDMFVLPSLFEGLPVVGVEAQMAGLPCLFSDSITAEAKFTSNVRFLSLQAPVEEWCENISEMTELQRTDPDELIGSKFDISTAVKKLEEIYA